MTMMDDLRELIFDVAFDEDDDQKSSETVRVRTSADDVSPVTREAQVRRELPENYGPNTSMAPRIQVMFVNDSTNGISSDEVDVGSWQVDVAERYGQVAAWRNIGRIVRHDAVGIILEMR